MNRRPGPPPPQSVRRAGDPEVAERLAAALVCSGELPARATHRFHTYPAGMHPDAARILLELAPGPVHDPFCGGGTVLVEARLADRPCSGADLSPVASLVAAARTAEPSLAGPLRSASRRIAEFARHRQPDLPVPSAVASWYEPHVAQEIARIKSAILAWPSAELGGQVPERPDDIAATRALLKAVLSSILVKASFRQSDTSPRRIPNHRPPGTTAILFHKKARELARGLEELPAGGRVRLRQADARRVPAPKGTGLVLTSPPYPGVYDYLPMQALRVAWLGLDDEQGAVAEIGSRRAFRARGRTRALRVWREDTARWIATQARNLVPGGRMVIFVGDGLVGGRNVDALDPTLNALDAAGLRLLARASADRPEIARGGVRTEHLVAAER